MKIGNHDIGSGHTFIIAEACSNIIRHLDDLDRIIQSVAWTGADALKVQLYKHTHFPLSEHISKAKTEFPRDRFRELVELCHSHGLACGASVFDEDAVKLVESSGADFLKLATRERGNESLRQVCIETNMPIVASYDNRNSGIIRSRLSNMQMMACWPEYPAVNVRVPSDCSDLGWSSHTSHDLDVLMAVTRGASVIEKHIAFHQDDHERGWSLMPVEFKSMVERIRWVESAR